MAKKRIALPKTLPECHALIVQLFERIEELEAELALLKRQIYGKKSERFLEDEISADTEAESDVVEAPSLGNEQDSGNASDDRDFENTTLVPPANQNPQVGNPENDSRNPSDLHEDVNVEPNADPQPKPKRTSRGRRRRVIPPDIERQKVYHRLNDDDVAPEMLHHPRARRFFRHVRDEIQFPRPNPILVEHYQEVLALDDPDKVQTKIVTATVPKPFLNRSLASVAWRPNSTGCWRFK